MKKIISVILCIIMTLSIGTTSFANEYNESSTDTIELFSSPTVYRQDQGSWASYPYGKGCTNGKWWNATIKTSGCALLSFVNAVYSLNGSFLEPTMLADFSIKNGYRVNGSGTKGSFVSGAAKEYGSKYGFKYEGAKTGKSDLKKALESGQTAVWHSPGHFMAISQYSSSSDKFLVLNSYPGAKISGTYAWKTYDEIKKIGITNFYLLSQIKPAAPHITSCDAKSDASIEIKWDKVSGAEKYKIVRHEVDGANKMTVTSDWKSTSFTDTKLQSGHTYYYVVYAGKGSKWSDASKEYKTYTKPSKPVASVKRDSTTQLTVSWNKVGGAQKYIIMGRTCKPGTSKPDYTVLKTVDSNVTSYTQKGLSKGTQYYYRVIAVREGNIGEAGNLKLKQVKSDHSDSKGAFTLFDRPKNSLNDDTGNTVLTWGAAHGDNTYAYRIERTSPSGQYADLGRTTALTYTDTTAPSGEICKYKITALKSDDGYKTAVTVGEFYAGSKIKKAVVLTPQNETTMRISWDNVKSATGVKYVVRKYVNNEYVDVNTTTNTYYDDKNLTPGKKYTYYVQVRDNNNNYMTSTMSAGATLEILPNKISLNRTDASMTVGETLPLTYTISPNNITNKNVTWNSSNTGVATVSNGTVTAVAEGTANITITTSNGKTASCTINVSPAACSHTYGEWIEETAATCENEGTQYKVCSKCNDIVREGVPATGHSYSEEWSIIKEGTCTEAGEQAHICTKCGSTSDITPIPATEHNFSGEWLVEKAATCLEDGVEYRQCANCDAKETRTIEKTSHNYVLTEETETTPDGPGHRTYTCNICNDSYTEEYVPEINEGIVEIGSGAPKAGGLVTLPVTISKNPGIAGFAFTVKYDKTALTPKEITRGELLTEGTFTSNLEQGIPATELNEVAVYWGDSSNITEDGTLFNITFEVNSTTPEGIYPVSLVYEKGDITDEAFDDVMPDVLDNVITIADVIKGDVNLDRRVDYQDELLLSRYIAKWNLTFNESQQKAANVFGDSKINAKDGVRLSQILSGYELIEAAPVSLFSTNEVRLLLDRIEAAAGDYISVPVTISDNAGIAGFNLRLDYDKEYLTPVAITKGDILADGSFTSNLTDEVTGEDLDYVTAYWNSSYNMTENGELFVVEFMVNGDVEAGQSLPIEINSTESELCDYTLNDINSITNSGEIYVLSNSNDTPEGDLSLGYYITDVAIKSSDGALYEKIPANGNFDAEVNFNTIYDSIEDVIPATMVVAAYTGSGVLISISTVPINEEKANNGFCTLHVDATDKDIASLKLFVWSSFNSLIPLSDVVRITN